MTVLPAGGAIIEGTLTASSKGRRLRTLYAERNGLTSNARGMMRLEYNGAGVFLPQIFAWSFSSDSDGLEAGTNATFNLKLTTILTAQTDLIYDTVPYVLGSAQNLIDNYAQLQAGRIFGGIGVDGYMLEYVIGTITTVQVPPFTLSAAVMGIEYLS